jgi:hypothetical protein
VAIILHPGLTIQTLKDGIPKYFHKIQIDWPMNPKWALKWDSNGLSAWDDKLDQIL